MNIILVAAIGEQRQLGLDNQLLWKLPGDLPRFKDMTMGSPIIMGRKTFDSIGKPLPGRLNIVISRDESLQIDRASVVSSVSDAIDCAKQEHVDNVFVIGGGEIYGLFLPVANALELTLVDDAPEADAFFPDYLDNFSEVSRQTNDANDLRYHYVRYERANKYNTSSQ